MLISYNTQCLQKICFNSATAIKYLGENSANCLKARHSDIQAAHNVFDLPFGLLSIEGNFCTLVVSGVLSIEMIPNYGSIGDDEFYDWETIERVKVMGINNVR